MSGDLKMLRDQRAPGARPKLSLLPRSGLVHASRGLAYGAAKYARANFMGPCPEGIPPVDRILGYLDALMRHATHITQAINYAKGTRGDQRAAVAVQDEEASGGFPASMLPHFSHILAGALIAVECAVEDGLLPADPGEPWTVGRPAHADDLPQKENPAAEKARVEHVVRTDPASPVLPPTLPALLDSAEDHEPSDEAKWWVRGHLGDGVKFDKGSIGRRAAQQVDLNQNMGAVVKRLKETR